MKSPWPEALIEKVGVANIIKLRRMTKQEAEVLLSNLFAEPLPEDEYALVMGITRNDVSEMKREPSTLYEEVMRGHRVRAQFIAGAWLAGASWNQLGQLFGVKRQSIMSSANRLLPNGAERMKARLSQESVAYGTVEAWWGWFQANPQILESDMTVRKLATHFITISDG